MLDQRNPRFAESFLHDLGQSPGGGQDAFKLYGEGTLQMLRVKGQPNKNLGLSYAAGTSFDVDWVTIDDPTAAGVSTVNQGLAKGGAAFKRLEGCFYHGRKVYIVSTNGGAVSQGQVWVYDPVAGTIELLFESPAKTALNMPDNIGLSPTGGIVLCEDGDVVPQRLRGLTTDGIVYEFARNNVILPAPINSIAAGNYSDSEWAGATFSPDGKFLFVNIQSPGVTFAITGPWGKGSL